jgi:hypothetical protein
MILTRQAAVAVDGMEVAGGKRGVRVKKTPGR